MTYTESLNVDRFIANESFNELYTEHSKVVHRHIYYYDLNVLSGLLPSKWNSGAILEILGYSIEDLETYGMDTVDAVVLERTIEICLCNVEYEHYINNIEEYKLQLHQYLLELYFGTGESYLDGIQYDLILKSYLSYVHDALITLLRGTIDTKYNMLSVPTGYMVDGLFIVKDISIEPTKYGMSCLVIEKFFTKEVEIGDKIWEK